MPRKEFEAFTRLDASDVNTFLMDQSVMTFADSTARTTAIPTPVEGMLTYLEDSNTYQSYNGSSYVTVADGTAWTSFTPSWTNLTVGNGVYNYSKFKVIGKTGIFCLEFVLGSTSSVTGLIQLNLPAALTRTDTATGVINGYALRSSAAYPFVSVFSGASDVRLLLRASNAAGTYVVSTDTSATIPITWTSGDVIVIGGTFEVI
jgi:hypothetical protein